MRPIPCIIFLSLFLGISPLKGQTLSGPKRTLYPIALPEAIGSAPLLAKEVLQVMELNLQLSGWFRSLDRNSFLANLGTEQLGIETSAWKSVGAFGVIKFKVIRSGNTVQLDFRLFEVEKGAAPVLKKQYKGTPKELRSFVHDWCNQVTLKLAKEKGFFGSKLAAAVQTGRGKKAILLMDHDGYNVRRVTRNNSINMLPRLSTDGRLLAYTSFVNGNTDLFLQAVGAKRARKISSREGMNTPGSFSPDGSKLAVTLSKDGNPEIYILNATTGAIIRRLTNNPAIDTSPAWSPDGREIAFVSDRFGGPQIFVAPANGGSAKRVSFNGSYNTQPTWSPVRGKRVLAYTTRDKKSYDIVTLDLSTQKMFRITQGQGQNQKPVFSPNGRAIAFTSRRKGDSGVYVSNAEGLGKQLRIFKGNVTSLSWSY